MCDALVDFRFVDAILQLLPAKEIYIVEVLTDELKALYPIAEKTIL